MKNSYFIGVDANEANLVQHRVGSNQFAYGLLKAIEKVDKSNFYQIYLSTPLLSDMPKERPMWNYRVIPPPFFWTRWRLPLDLYFHRPSPKIFLSLGHYIPRFSPIPRVAIITDLGYLKFPEHLLKKDLFQLKVWTAYSIKMADHIIAISEFTKNDIMESYSVAEAKISVVYPGYDNKVFNESLKKINAEHILKKYKIDCPYILFLGALKPSKNLERLLQAFSLLKTKHLKLVIAGKRGWLYNSIFDVVSKLKLKEHVIFTDFVPDEEVSILMSHAEVFTLPSLYEGFGMPVIESMACGVSVVVSDRGSLPEVVGDSGIVVDPYDVKSIAEGIEKALKEKKILAERGLTQVKNFSWEISARKTIEILKRYI